MVALIDKTSDLELQTSSSVLPRMTEKMWRENFLGDREIVHIQLRCKDRHESWEYMSRNACASLNEALQINPNIDFENCFLKLSIFFGDNPTYASVAQQLKRSNFYDFIIVLEGGSEIGNLENQVKLLENALFLEGFRKSSGYYNLTGYQELNEPQSRVVLSYRKLPAAIAEVHNMEYLLKGRDLHMDMLREHGVRSDGHVFRYHFAAHEIAEKLGEGGTIIDACSGLGYGTKLLADACQPLDIVGVDIDEDAIAYAQAVYSQETLCRFVHSPLLDYLKQLKTSSIDAIVMFEGLEHLADVEECLYEINRVLTPNGLYFSSIPNQWVNEEGIDENEFHLSVFEWNSFRECLSQYLAVESTYSQTASRINTSGKWLPRERGFVAHSPKSFEPIEAEWWIAVCRPRSNVSTLKTEARLQKSFDLQEAICRVQAPDIKVVSFDIFDTLLSRPTLSATDPFVIVQLKLVLKFGQHFERFATLRRLAEKQARQIAHKKGLGDITIEEIYLCLSSLLALNESEAADIMKMEMEVEASLLRPRLGSKALYDAALKAGKQVIAISDMYLPEAFLAKILSDKGYNQLSYIWCSSEHKVQKRTGKLYEVVLGKLANHQIEPDEILHIGDNYGSDIEMANLHGVQTLYIKRAAEQYSGNTHAYPGGPLVEHINKLDLSMRSFVGCQIDSVFHDPFRQIELGTIFERDPYLFGRLRLSPLVYFSMLKFVKSCAAMDIEQVYFVCRDGHLPKHVFEKIADHLGVKIKAHDLHLSRVMITLLHCKTVEDLCRYVTVQVSANKGYSLSQILAKLLGLDEKEFLQGTISQLPLNDISAFCNPLFIDNAVQNNALIKHFWHVIEALLKQQQEAFLKYINNINWDKKTAIWDVGYFHTVATSLGALGIEVALSGHMVSLSHHQDRVSTCKGNFIREDYFGSINNSEDKNLFDTGFHSPLFELFLSDPSTASRTTFTSDGGVVVLPEKADLRKNNRASIDAMHEGVVEAVDDFIQAYGSSLDHSNCSAFQLLQYSFGKRAIEELSEGVELLFDNETRLNIADFFKAKD